jgi:hypothetical protein
MESTALPVLAIFGDDLVSQFSGLRVMAGVHGARIRSARRSQLRDAGDVRLYPGYGHWSWTLSPHHRWMVPRACNADMGGPGIPLFRECQALKTNDRRIVK